jgi:hypothetical protein
MSILQDKNAAYLIAAYIVFLGGMGLYLASLVVRRKTIERDEQALSEIEKAEKTQ